MAQYICPHCRHPLDIPSGLAGSVVECDMCGGKVSAPATMVPYAPEPPAMRTAPQFIVVSTPTPRYQPRLHSGGWFYRAFASTFGVLMAIFAVNLILVIVGLFCVVVFFQIASANRPQNQPPVKSAARR